jgi:lipopolysaccharide assembly protein A
MSAPNRTPNEPTDAPTITEPPPSPARPPMTDRVPRTRTGVAWIGICAAALALVALIVFMMQNTGNVEVTFLWMHGTLPLAMALLIAGVGVTMLTMIVGTARITQLRRLFVRRAAKPHPDVNGSTS